MITMKDGDIFRWYFRVPQGTYAYWCKSQIAVFRNGRLTDTYWNLMSDSISWTCEEANEMLVLKYLGNFADLEKRPEYDAKYYDAGDIVDLNHPNSSSGNFHIRKGAKRSRAKMLEQVQYEVEKAQSAMRMAQFDVERLTKIVEQVTLGADLDQIFF